jgi:3-isopropylmalate dehydrogenase
MAARSRAAGLRPNASARFDNQPPGGAAALPGQRRGAARRHAGACRAADAILFGAMGLPHVRGNTDGTEIIPQLDIRFALDLYAGVRPIRTWPGLPTPLADPRAGEIDLVLVRESTEGLFYARGRGVIERRRRLRHDEDHPRRHGPGLRLRVAAGAPAQGAGPRPARVTNVDKANVFTSMAFWRQVFEERAKAPSPTCADTPMSTRWR